MWLKKVGNVTGKSMNGGKVDLIGAVHDNPLPGNPTPKIQPTGHMYIFSCV